jgi:hypothetical protein
VDRKLQLGPVGGLDADRGVDREAAAVPPRRDGGRRLSAGWPLGNRAATGGAGERDRDEARTLYEILQGHVRRSIMTDVLVPRDTTQEGEMGLNCSGASLVSEERPAANRTKSRGLP